VSTDHNAPGPGKELAPLCIACWTELGFEMELTPAWQPHDCARCGKTCWKQGDDFKVVWWKPAPLRIIVCRSCVGQHREHVDAVPLEGGCGAGCAACGKTISYGEVAYRIKAPPRVDKTSEALPSRLWVFQRTNGTWFVQIPPFAEMFGGLTRDEAIGNARRTLGERFEQIVSIEELKVTV